MADVPPISSSNHPIGQPLPNNKTRKKRDKYTQNESIQKTSDLEQIEYHVSNLISGGDIRPEMIELGKQLAKAKDFPSAETLDKLAETLLGPIDDVLDEDKYR